MAGSGDVNRNSRAHCRMLRHMMITNIWLANGFTGRDLEEHHEEMTTPLLVRDGSVHPVHEDWREERRRSLPLVAVGGREGGRQC